MNYKLNSKIICRK